MKGELDRLHSQGHIALESVDVRSGPSIMAYRLTESGVTLLEALSN